MACSLGSFSYTLAMLERIVSTLNEAAHSDRTKKFNVEILSAGTFSFCCPILQEPIYPTHNFYKWRRTTIYIFEGAERLALIFSGQSFIAAVTSTNQFILPHVNSLEENLPNGGISFLRSYLRELPKHIPNIDINLNPRLISARTHFAHFIWNDLPSIENAISSKKEIEVYLVWDAFNLRINRHYSGKLFPISLRNAIEGWSSHLTFMCTSTFISDKVRKNFLRNIINERNPEDKTVYISVRPNSLKRSLINQMDFLCCLISTLHEKYDDITFILDGFSVPDDICLSPYPKKYREGLLKIVEQSNSLIQKLIRALPSVRNNIYNINGMKFSDALEHISTCSYYVCHAGSQQHKIAWLFPRNGYMHSNRASISDGFKQWVSRQSECSIIPSTPDFQYIEDVTAAPEEYPSDRFFKRNTRNAGHNLYKIKCVNSIVSHIVQDYSKHVIGKFN